MNRTVELLNDLRHSREGSLCIALEAVNDIANHALLDLLGVSSSPGEAQVRYKSHVHQQLFLIRLLDFAKEGGNIGFNAYRTGFYTSGKQPLLSV